MSEADLRDRVAAIVAKWSGPPLENPSNTLILRDFRALLAEDPS